MDWVSIRQAYMRGDQNLKQLAEEYGVNYSELRTKVTREKWAQKKKLALSGVQLEDVYQDTAELILKKLRQSLESEEAPLSQNLRQYTATLRDLMRIRGVQHEQDLQEQRARIEKLQSQAHQETHENTVEVVLTEQMQQWAK